MSGWRDTLTIPHHPIDQRMFPISQYNALLRYSNVDRISPQITLIYRGPAKIWFASRASNVSLSDFFFLVCRKVLVLSQNESNDRNSMGEREQHHFLFQLQALAGWGEGEKRDEGLSAAARYLPRRANVGTKYGTVAYQVIVEPGIRQFREFEPRRVRTRVNSLGLFLVHKLTCGKRESVS